MELVQDYIKQYVKLDPSKEIFFDPDTYNPVTKDIVTYFHIHNTAPITAENNIAFKIKTTNP